jgi:hypothetical protein
MIVSHEIKNETITLHFSRKFKQIKFIKISGENSENECEMSEIKYTISKDVLQTTFKNDMIFTVTEIDKDDTLFVYKVNDEGNTHIQEQEQDTFSALFSGHLGLTAAFDKSQSNINNPIQIKNQKIFATFRRK